MITWQEVFWKDLSLSPFSFSIWLWTNSWVSDQLCGIKKVLGDIRGILYEIKWDFGQGRNLRCYELWSLQLSPSPRLDLLQSCTRLQEGEATTRWTSFSHRWISPMNFSLLVAPQQFVQFEPLLSRFSPMDASITNSSSSWGFAGTEKLNYATWDTWNLGNY